MHHIEKILVLSTGHVSKEVADILETGDSLGWGPEFVRDEGWMFHVPPLECEKDTNPPRCVRDAFALARARACEWVMFDCDGPQVDELRWHVW